MIRVLKSWSRLFALRHGKRVAPPPQLDSEAQGGRRGSSWGGDSWGTPQVLQLRSSPRPRADTSRLCAKGAPGRGLTRALEGRLD